MKWYEIEEKPKLKRLVIFSIIIIAIAYIIVCYGNKSSNLLQKLVHITSSESYNIVTNEYDINVHFLDVGNGDCILLSKDDTNVLIDTGHDYNYKYVQSYLKSLKIDELDAIILSHSDADHMGGLESILQDFSVDYIYHSFGFREEFKELQNAEFVEAGDKFIIGDMKFSVLLPNEESEESNENSLVVLTEYKDFSMLLTGDIEENQVEYLVNYVDVSADILKVPHHGSEGGTSKDFVEKINPVISVVSVGTENKYLPNRDTLDILKNHRTLLYQTKESGTIIISTNGDGSYEVTTENRKETK